MCSELKSNWDAEDPNTIKIFNGLSNVLSLPQQRYFVNSTEKKDD
jgi:hypothetical protein